MLPQEERIGWKRWLPIRQWTPQEAEARRAQERQAFLQRVQLTQEGGLPVLVQREQQQQQQRESASGRAPQN